MGLAFQKLSNGFSDLSLSMTFYQTTTKNRRRPVRGLVFRTVILRAFAVAYATLTLAGCGPDRFIVLTTPPPGSGSLTGNWQITATTTSGAPPFSALTGSFLEGTPGTTGQTPLFAILQAVNPNSCFIGLTTVPLEGTLTGSSLSLLSLSDSGQYVNISGTSGSTQNTFTGNFSISDGCANGVKGSLSGTKIAPLSGTYSGPWTLGSGGNPLTLTLSQDSSADGLGYFHLQGSAAFTGLTCFTSGTLESSVSTISGQEVQMTFTTNEMNPSMVTMSGSLDPAAMTLTLTSIQVISGSCSGDSGTASLTS